MVSLSNAALPSLTEQILFPVDDNVTTATGPGHGQAGATWQPAPFPDGCSSSVTPGNITSVPAYPITADFITGGGNNSIPAWYLPSTGSQKAW